ncbi:MAG: hypothetical protein ACKOYM_01525, partial [Actinomycetes bacterium]
SGRATGWDVDLLALSSGRGGRAGVDTLATPPRRTPPPPSTDVERTGRLSYRFSVSGAKRPYWIVLGQSHSVGWSASTSAGVDLGPPTPINGFANGWYVDPASSGADLSVSVHWQPQRMVWIALALSLLGALACLWCVLRPPSLGAGRNVRQRRIATIEPHGIGALAVDGEPLNGLPLMVTSAAIGAAAGLFMPWWGAIVVAVVTGVALGARRGQALLRLVALAVLAAAMAFIVAKQFRNNYPVDFEWMNFFGVTHVPTLVGVALVVVDPLVELLRQRRGRSHTANSTSVESSISPVVKNSDAVIPD